jgi:DNA polymerase III epsilon subunit-like protein
MNLHNIAVIDFETDGKDPYTCEPTELACVMIHPKKLEIIPDSEFFVQMRPSDIDMPDYIKEHESTIKFHVKASGKSQEEILESWRNATQQKTAWETFVNYLGRYHTTQERKCVFTAPICAGYNIMRYDLVIIDRLAQKYGNIDKRVGTSLFFPRDKIDVMFYAFAWFEGMSEPASYSMDILRPFFGIDSEGSHSAMKDVKDTADILIRFLRLHRRTAEKVKFKDAFKPAPIELPGENNG